MIMIIVMIIIIIYHDNSTEKNREGHLVQVDEGQPRRKSCCKHGSILFHCVASLGWEA